ncbi:MAG: 4Fe-4S binding protein, partial [Casimicrobiaceae bacterium]
AIALAPRSLNREVATMDSDAARGWDAVLIVFGMIGLAVGAFEWSATPAFVALRTAAAGFVIDHGPAWVLADNGPWWLLTHYPEAHDVFTWLDGILIVGWIAGTALLVGGWIGLWLALAARPVPGRWQANAFALAYALTPLAGVGLFVGLTSLTATLAHGEGLHFARLPLARTLLLVFGGVWSVWLAHRQLSRRVGGVRRALSLSGFVIAVAGGLAAWIPFVFR